LINAKVRQLVLILLVLLLLHAVASADIIVGYIPSEGVKVTSTAWYVWFEGKVQPKYPGKIQYHEVENVESLNVLMNTFSMIGFAVLSESQLKEFQYLSGFVGPVTISENSQFIAREEIDEGVLAEFENILADILVADKEKSLPKKTNSKASPQSRPDTVKFIRELYLKILKRKPDHNGLAYWVGKIDSGEITHEQAVESIRKSKEVRVKQ
jgi:hypothetical protein